MTANELAVYLEDITDSEESPYRQAATMLRQQAQKIENLLDQYQRLNENLEMWKTGHFKQQAEIEALKPYKEKIEMMEQAYDAHIKKSMGEVKDLIKKASDK